TKYAALRADSVYTMPPMRGPSVVFGIRADSPASRWDVRGGAHGRTTFRERARAGTRDTRRRRRFERWLLRRRKADGDRTAARRIIHRPISWEQRLSTSPRAREARAFFRESARDNCAHPWPHNAPRR